MAPPTDPGETEMARSDTEARDTCKIATYANGETFTIRFNGSQWLYAEGKGTFPLAFAVKLAKAAGATVTKTEPKRWREGV